MATYILKSKYYPRDTYTLLLSKSGESKPIINNWQLPLPNQLNYNSDYEWSSEDALSKGLGAIGSGIDTIMNLSGKGGPNQNQPKWLQKAGGMKGLFNMGRRGLDPSNIGMRLAGYASGQAYNPNKMLFFQGVPHRAFAISFEMIAENQKQANEMAAGIQKLRYDAAPGYNSGHLFFDYPNYFTMVVKVLGKTVIERPLMAIKTITINFSSGNGVMSFHYDGKPIQYTIDLQCFDVIIETAKTESERGWLGLSGQTSSTNEKSWWESLQDTLKIGK